MIDLGNYYLTLKLNKLCMYHYIITNILVPTHNLLIFLNSILKIQESAQNVLAIIS